ncbi:hypothetical protein [Helicobacter winghamensis]|uniref:hypothetical protein n=1 Tax=Helicobacter winghamensis TaxID=157268 RepID=UPI00351BD6D6
MIGKIKNAIKSFIYRVKLQQDKSKFPPRLYPIELSKNEKAYIIKTFKGVSTYLEFGSGGSTFLALLNSKANIISVKSSKQWINYLIEWDFIKENVTEERLKFHYVDIGKTGEWGFPLDKDRKELFPEYSQAVLRYAGEGIDLIFVDGRFRVACVIASLLICSKNTKILIHDFNNREYYHCILEFVEFVDTCDTLAEFRMKANIKKERLLEVYNEYKYNPQ